MSEVRGRILESVRYALDRRAESPVPGPPRFEDALLRAEIDSSGEVDRFMAQIRALGGAARKMTRPEVPAALAALVETEGIRSAILWETEVVQRLTLGEILGELGVLLVGADAPVHQVADCDLGVTGVDLALADTGTIALCSSIDRSPLASLLPRVHLALAHASDLCVDLNVALSRLEDESRFVLITGPSRTADIELTVTLGVHGPEVLHVWVIDD
jgi:L-lactate dehydrogenase complex protein LldG